jgi:hypothetical protein
MKHMVPVLQERNLRLTTIVALIQYRSKPPPIRFMLPGSGVGDATIKEKPLYGCQSGPT